MTCKNCNQELPEYGKFCPHCGAALEEPAAEEVILEEATVQEALPEEVVSEEIPAEENTEEISGEEATEETSEEAQEETSEEFQEEEPAPKCKLKTWQLVTAIVCGVVALALVVGAVLYGLGIDLRPRENDIYYRDSYSASDEKLVKNSRDVVATMGDKVLTVGEFQMHYQTAFSTFYSQNYYYMSYMGLDVTKPLDQQIMIGSEDMTWQQYFVEAALDNWQSYVTMELLAEQAGHTLAPELADALNNLDANVLEMAISYGYDSVEAWMAAELGAGITMDDYARYNHAYYMGSDYLNHFYEDQYPTADEIEAYFAENEATFLENGISKDMGLNASVRHILITPETNGTDESGNPMSTEDDWAAARTEAERILQEWKDGDATEESFAELANTYSADGGSNTTGGLYEDVNVDASYVANFENWAIDSARVAGDVEIVETEFGYHIMYFVEGEEYWPMVVGEQLLAERVKTMLQQCMEANPVEVNYKKILVGELMLF